MTRRVTIQWTEKALASLRRVPKKIGRIIRGKVSALQDADPLTAHKPLAGTLKRFRSIKVSRYRVLYSATEETLANGDIVVHVRVRVVLVGQRRQSDRDDVYKLAERLIRFAALDGDRGSDDNETDT